jgi:hypothetical protein
VIRKQKVISIDTPRLMASVHTIEKVSSCEPVYRILKKYPLFQGTVIKGKKSDHEI